MLYQERKSLLITLKMEQVTEVGGRNGIGLSSTSEKLTETWMQSERGTAVGCEGGSRTGKGLERKKRSGVEKVGRVKSIDIKKEAGT